MSLLSAILLRASNKMNCRNESERFFARQGGRVKIAAGIAKAMSRTILRPTTPPNGKQARLNAKVFC